MAIKVLLVDDARELARLIVERGEQAGFAMIAADTGRAAVDLAEREQPDLIILDPTLLDLSGAEAF